ncbi:MAG: hypothetical protein ACU0DK_10250 [Pseudooceanicola sp.]
MSPNQTAPSSPSQQQGQQGGTTQQPNAPTRTHQYTDWASI